MKCMRLIPCIALLLLVAPLPSANAQIRDPLTSRIAPASGPDTSAAALLKRIEALESTIAQLQQKLAFVKSVNPLVLDAGVNTGVDLTLRGARVTVEASNFDLKAGASSTISSQGTLTVEARDILDLKGLMVRHNAGTMSIACYAYSNGQYANAVGPCSGKVLVPPPFQ